MINIPYFKYQNSDGTYSKLPIIPVRLACNKNHQWVYALLDSGADMSLFNASIAKLLNVTVKDGDPISVYGVMDFAQSTAYLHQVNLSVAGLRSVDTNVAFSDDEVYPQLAILGRRDSSKSVGSSLTVMNE
jgi:hypothetical protein